MQATSTGVDASQLPGNADLGLPVDPQEPRLRELGLLPGVQTVGQLSGWVDPPGLCRWLSLQRQVQLQVSFSTDCPRVLLGGTLYLVLEYIILYLKNC